MKRVLLVEQDPMVRRLLELFIEGNKEYSLICSMENEQMPDNCCEHIGADMIVMGLSEKTVWRDLKILEKVKVDHPQTKILVMTDISDYSLVEESKNIGVDCFWYKSNPPEKIMELMDRTLNGESIYPEQYLDVPMGDTMSSEFTAREIEVLRELVQGTTDTEIAEKLSVSLRTIKTHLQNMREKTGFRNRTDLAVWASTSGFVVAEMSYKTTKLHESTMCKEE